MTGQLESMDTFIEGPMEPLDTVPMTKSNGQMPARARSALTWLALAIAPTVLFLLLRPDWYYQQNGLDPYFYTGYAQNFDDVLHVGAHHYFVTRWSIYLPQVYLVALFGPLGGYLVFRVLLAAVIVGCVYALARRWWNVPTMWLVIITTLCSPLLLRPLFSDYSDAVFVPLGFAIITLLALWPSHPAAAATAGAAAAMGVAANPVAATIALSALGAWLFIAQSWRRRVVFVSLFGVGFLVVIVGSAVWFRVRYGLDELYEPTIEFFRARVGVADAVRSPRMLWLGYYLWIYLPAIVLLTAAWLRRARSWNPVPGQRMILTACALQYAFQIWYEFARKGTTLETPYYWSYMVPSLLLATAVVVAQLAKDVPARQIVVLSVVVVAVLFVAPSPFPSATSWIDVAIGVGLVGYLGWRCRDRYPVVALSLISTLCITIPLVAPARLPLAPGEQTVMAKYGEIFKSTDSAGQDGFDALEWWVTQANAFGDDVEQSMYFWIGGGHGHRLAAAYLAHASGRWVNAGWGRPPAEALVIDDSRWSSIETCQVPYLALVGSPDDVDKMLSQLQSHNVAYTSIFDGTAPSADPTRAEVVRIGPCPA